MTRAELEVQTIDILPAREVPLTFSFFSIVGSGNANTAQGVNLLTLLSANAVQANQAVIIG